jgi:hypothetical protein
MATRLPIARRLCPWLLLAGLIGLAAGAAGVRWAADAGLVLVIAGATLGLSRPCR